MEETSPIPEPINTLPIKYVSLPEQKILELLEINKILRAKNEHYENTIAKMLTSAVILSKQIDFKRPWKAVAFFMDLVKNTEKYKVYTKPFEELLDNNEDLRKRIELHYQKELEKQKLKK